MAQQDREFDVVVIGGGAVGENVADRAGRTGLSVALVEHELVGGECSYWACMPSKALLRPGAVLAAARGVPGRRRGGDGRRRTSRRRSPVATRSPTHWDDSSQVDWVEGTGITLLRGHARFTGPRALDGRRPTDGPVAGHRPARGGRRDRVSAACCPTSTGLADAAAVDQPGGDLRAAGARRGWRCSAAASSASRWRPRSPTSAATVTLLVRGDRLLTGAEPFAGEAVAASLDATSASTVLLRHRDPRRPGATPTACTCDLRHRAGPGGRRGARRDRPATAHRGPGPRDDRARAGRGRSRSTTRCRSPGSTAAGCSPPATSTGRTATTHQGKYDARVVGDVIAARFDPRSSATTRRGRDAGDRSLAPTTSGRRAVEPVPGDRRRRAPSRRSCSPGPRSPGSG